MKQSFSQHHQMPDKEQAHHCASAAPAAPAPAYYPPNYPQYEQYLYRYGDNGEFRYLPAQSDPNALAPASDYPAQPALSGWFDFSDSCYLKGFLTGAALTFLLTNSAVQKAVVRGAVKLMSAVQGGVEEVKEQIKDIKAEMSQKEVRG